MLTVVPSSNRLFAVPAWGISLHFMLISEKWLLETLGAGVDD